MTMFEELIAVLDKATTKISLIEPDEKAAARLKEVYPFHEETVFGVVLSKTGGIVIDNWIRIYGSGKYDFYGKNTSLSEWGATIIAEDIVGFFRWAIMALSVTLPRIRCSGKVWI